MPLPITVAGVMSGTSLDGLDVAVCRFEQVRGNWSFEVLAATTFPFDADWQLRLSHASALSGLDLARLNTEFGVLAGTKVRDFCNSKQLRPDLVSSHGHTIFHDPKNGLTMQIGSGAVIAAITGIDTVCDFRATDVALGGQGAPLVPLGDQILFGGHRFCLNLGGIANVSYDQGGHRIACDICPVNMALNYLSSQAGKAFDRGGELALRGKLIPELLDKLNALSFYKQPPPKSLGREWFEREFLPVITDTGYTIPDLLYTASRHAAIQIAASLFHAPGTTLFTTGGGAYNTFLVELIEDEVSRHGIHVVVPDATVVDFKEAIVFAFLGMLRETGTVNVLASVTGAERDSVSGAVYKG